MKSAAFLLSLFMLGGCYTQLRIPQKYDYGFPYQSERDYSDNQAYTDDANYAYQDGYEDGYQQGVQVFTDWNVASRWNSYYNRFYWADPYWGAGFYDPFLWDPFWGFYGGWGLSYYQAGYSYWWGARSPYWGWSWGWPGNAWANVVVVRNNSDNGNTRWTYGPRDFGPGSMMNVRGSRTSVQKTGFNGDYTRGTRINTRGSRTGSYTVPTRSRGSSGASSSGGSIGRPSSSGSSGSSGARPSRTGNNQSSYTPASTTKTPSVGLPSSTRGSTAKSSASKGSSSSSKKSNTRPSRTGN